VNPVVYALLNRDFRTAFEHLLRCRWHGESSAGQDAVELRSRHTL